jgi:hypothetical protein
MCAAVISFEQNKDFVHCKSIVNEIRDIDVISSGYKEIMTKGGSIKRSYEDWQERCNVLQRDYQNLADEMKAQGLWCFNCDRPLARANSCDHKEH